MKFSTSIVWLVMAAVINPLCCCLGSLHGSESGKHTLVMHACCNNQADTHSTQDTSQNSEPTKECPHQLEKKAPKIQVSVDHAPLLTPMLGLWLGLLQFTTFPQQTPVSQATSSTQVATDNSPPGNHRLLCIYLI